MRPPYLQGGPLKRLLIVAKFTQLRLFLSFLAICCIRFLTLINNLVAIFQRAFHGIIIPFQIHRGDSFLLYLFRGFMNLVQSYKV